MKKLLSMIFVLTFLVSCDSIQVKKDDFQNLTTAHWDTNHSISDWSGLMLYSTEVKYYRAINKYGVSTPTTINFEMIGTAMAGPELDTKAFISADDQKFNLVLTDRELEKLVVVSDDDKGGKRSSKASAKATKTHRGKLTLTSSIEKAIKNAKSISYRLYIGTKPITYVLKEGEVLKLKEFLNIKNL